MNPAALPLFFQIIRFGFIGTLAALVHFSMLVGLVEFNLMKPLLANVIAFSVAFQVSYWGHRFWTFQATTLHRIAMPRLLLVAASNLAANQGFFYVFLTLFHLPYKLALIVTLMVLPAVTFTFGKFWVFK